MVVVVGVVLVKAGSGTGTHSPTLPARDVTSAGVKATLEKLICKGKTPLRLIHNDVFYICHGLRK